MLGACIGLDPQIVQSELDFNGDIFPIDENRLNINRDGMQQILRLIVENKEVQSVNFLSANLMKKLCSILRNSSRTAKSILWHFQISFQKLWRKNC